MALLVPSNTMRAILVDEDGIPYTAGTPVAAGSFNPSDTAQILLVDEDGNPYVAGGGGGGGTVTEVSAGNLSPLFTTNVATPTTTPALTFSLSTAAANTVLGNATGSTAAPSYAQIVAGQIASDAVTTVKILNDNVTTAKILNANVTLAKIASAAANSKLLGSGASGSGAAYAELTLGTNLSMSGTTLNAASGTTPGITLVQNQLITSNSTTVTFSSLDGNTDVTYYLVANIINNSGGSTYYYWLPNNLTTNLTSNWNNIGTTTTTTLAAKLQLSTSASGGDIANGTFIQITLTISAKNNPNSIAFPRSYQSRMTNYTTAPAANGGAGYGIWNETATNLTSLVFAANNANGIGNGSNFQLYKYAQA